METYKLVMPEHLNHFGFLFGGYMLKWVDEIAWIAATQEFTDCKFVTIAMDNIEFKQSVTEGTILRFQAELTHRGNTSVQYTVTVTKGDEPAYSPHPVFSNHVTMVRVDEHGNKKRLDD